jgi:hypothetical protein
VIGTLNRRQCSQAATAPGGAGRRDDHGAEALIIVQRALADQESERKARRGDHAADEGEQQDDARQRHAAAPGEELGQPPGDQRHRHACPKRGTGEAEPRTDRIADPGDRDQQDHGRDADEDVVEAGQQPEVLLIHHRRCAQARDMGAQRGGLSGRDHAGRHGTFQIGLAVHGRPPCRPH